MVRWFDQSKMYEWNGKLSKWKQCFYSSALVLLSFFIPAISDAYVLDYVDDTEATVGKAGIAEKLMKQFSWITGRTGAFWIVHQYAIEQRLLAAGYKGKMIFRDYTGTWDEVRKALKHSPVIIGTQKMAGLPRGHLICIVRESVSGWVVMDPNGNAQTLYTDRNGDSVEYHKNFLSQYTEDKNKKIQIMYFEPV